MCLRENQYFHMLIILKLEKVVEPSFLQADMSLVSSVSS